MLFIFHSEILHRHCLQFLLGVKMAPRETENNAYAKFGVTNKEHYGMLWYFLEWSIEAINFTLYILSTDKEIFKSSNPYLTFSSSKSLVI